MLLYLLNDKVLQRYFFLFWKEKKYFAICIKKKNSSHQYVNILEIEKYMYF